jgi:hypothetical protein
VISTTMAEDRLLLGFDARRSDAPEWDERRRRNFLFRLDVVRPLSIDAEVWSSGFDSDSDERADWIGIFDPLWENLGALREAVRAAEGLLGRTSIAAFGRMTGDASAAERTALETQMRGIHPDGTPGDLPATIADPATVQPGWRFLGYDVADLWGLSGLMNCGFLPGEDVANLRARWGPRLNGFHLFDEIADAREFQGFANQRSPEHAPFFVDGIWLVEGRIV